MDFIYLCPYCFAEIGYEDREYGIAISCPDCGQPIVLGESEEEWRYE